MVTALDFSAISDEFMIFLRNSDILSVSTRGVTTVTDEFDGDNSTTEFTLTNTGVKNVRSVTIDSVSQTEYVDYTVSYDFSSNQTKVVFTSAPASGTDNVDVQYDYGTGDKIYNDWPRLDLTLSSYPRVGFDIINSNSQDITLRGEITQTTFIISITVFAETQKLVFDTIKLIRSAVQNNKLGFYNINYLQIDTQGPLIVNERSQGKIYQRNLDLRAILQFEQ